MNALKKSNATDARIAVLSARNIDLHVSRSHGFEFENLICDMDHADIFAPSSGRLFRPIIKGKNWASYRWSASDLLPSGLTPSRIERNYELFFVSIASLRDLNFLDGAGEWRKKCRFAVVWIQELWLDAIERHGALIKKLEEFDLVVCSFSQTTKELSAVLDTKVVYEPWGVDALKFCPYPNPPKRSIDALSFGVRHPSTHRKLVDYFDNSGGLYLYETVSGRSEMPEVRSHRANFIGQIQRSRFLFSHIAKIDKVEERGDQVEFGLRYLEGAAAGAVVLGDEIDSEAFRKHLGWQDAVIPFPYECEAPGERIDALLRQPGRLESASVRNIENCLKRHDHLNRWELVLAEAGLDKTVKMEARRRKLASTLQALPQRPLERRMSAAG